jgi:hypothetical protein
VRYRARLRAVVAASAAPYGYTLTIWTSGAVTTHHQGLPSTGQALLFLVGAVTGFALVGALANGGASGVLASDPEPGVRVWGGFHLPAVGLAIALAAGVDSMAPDTPAWALVGFTSTAVYLLTIAAQFTLAEKR